jgi:hypothetical protein
MKFWMPPNPNNKSVLEISEKLSGQITVVRRDTENGGKAP